MFTTHKKILIALVLSGCAAESENSSVADDEAVLDHVEALGYPRGAAQVHAEHVTIGDDIVFERDALVHGAYERFRPPHALVDKGYARILDLIADEHQGKIKLAFATGKHAPSTTMRDAFVAAAKAWSGIPGSAIRISTANTGPSIVIRSIPTADWSQYPQCRGSDACAAFPLDGRPGKEVLVRAKPSRAGCSVWSSSALINMTRHELGHALGFDHPESSKASHVDGTAECQYYTEKDCLEDPDLYSTVMGPYLVEAGCVVTPSRLTRDDYLTCAAVYPAP